MQIFDKGNFFVFWWEDNNLSYAASVMKDGGLLRSFVLLEHEHRTGYSETRWHTIGKGIVKGCDIQSFDAKPIAPKYSQFKNLVLMPTEAMRREIDDALNEPEFKGIG